MNVVGFGRREHSMSRSVLYGTMLSDYKLRKQCKPPDSYIQHVVLCPLFMAYAVDVMQELRLSWLTDRRFC